MQIELHVLNDATGGVQVQENCKAGGDAVHLSKHKGQLMADKVSGKPVRALTGCKSSTVHLVFVWMGPQSATKRKLIF